MAQGPQGLGRIEPWPALYQFEREDLVPERLARRVAGFRFRPYLTTPHSSTMNRTVSYRSASIPLTHNHFIPSQSY
nr:MAG TPA: hypothetical protein [Caudoviricetes sp.]